VLRDSEEPDRHYLVLEDVAGAPLAGPLPPDESPRLAARVGSALEVAHRSGILHRDLRPANILVSDAGSPGGRAARLLDFGLANEAVPVSDATLTAEGHEAQKLTPDGLARSREWYEQAIALDPEFALAHGMSAFNHAQLAIFGLVPAQNSAASSRCTRPSGSPTSSWAWRTCGPAGTSLRLLSRAARAHSEPQHHGGRETRERDELLTESGSIDVAKLRPEVPCVGVDVDPWSHSNEHAPAGVAGRQRRLERECVERILQTGADDASAARAVRAESRRRVWRGSCHVTLPIEGRHTSLADQVAGTDRRSHGPDPWSRPSGDTKVAFGAAAGWHPRAIGVEVELSVLPGFSTGGPDERPDDPVGRGFRRDHRDEGADPGRSETGRHGAAWMNARAKGETATSPDVNGNRLLKPSLFASRINVRPRSGSLSISDENVGHCP
jgi:hypothetical protein